MANKLKIPVKLSSKTDVFRLIRELESLEDKFSQKEHGNDSDNKKMPEISVVLEELCEVNGVDANNAKTRAALKNVMERLLEVAPTMHISFAARPEQDFLDKITSWFRQEVHPYSLLHIGIQPGIAAGCTLRTRSKYFDMSLKQHLAKNSGLLGTELRGGQSG